MARNPIALFRSEIFKPSKSVFEMSIAAANARMPLTTESMIWRPLGPMNDCLNVIGLEVSADVDTATSPDKNQYRNAPAIVIMKLRVKSGRTLNGTGSVGKSGPPITLGVTCSVHAEADHRMVRRKSWPDGSMLY